jgi:hypothetical protein
MRVYVAGSWRNAQRIHDIVVGLRSVGSHEVYDFTDPHDNGQSGFTWDEVSPDWKSWTVEQYVEALQHPAAVKGFNADMAAMARAEVCLLVLPCGSSAHSEAGWFAGKGVPVIVYVTAPFESELMYAMFDFITDTLGGAFNHIDRLQLEKDRIRESWPPPSGDIEWAPRGRYSKAGTQRTKSVPAPCGEIPLGEEGVCNLGWTETRYNYKTGTFDTVETWDDVAALDHLPQFDSAVSDLYRLYRGEGKTPFEAYQMVIDGVLRRARATLQRDAAVLFTKEERK